MFAYLIIFLAPTVIWWKDGRRLAVNSLSSTPKRSRYSYKVCGHCNRELSAKNTESIKGFIFKKIHNHG